MSVPDAIILTNNNPQLIRPYSTNTSLSFYWTTPVSDGGEPVESYILREISPGTSSTVFGSTSFSTRVTSLTNGTEYSYEIAASNVIGVGPYSQFRTVQPGNKPGPVSTLTATVNFTTVTLTWTPPASNGGATVKWYVIKGYDKRTGNLVYNTSVRGYTTQKTYYNITNAYVFYVYAVNDPGYSSSMSITVYINLIALNASSYSGSGPWYNASSNPSVPSATIAEGTIAKNGDGNGIILDGSSYWTFPNIALGPIWSVGVWYKNTGTPTGVGASIVTQESSNGGINVALGYSVFDGGLAGPIVGSFLSAGGWGIGTPVSPYVDGVWNNIFVTYDGTTLRTYVNGTLLGTVVPGFVSSDFGTQYRIGARWDQPYYLVGEIGELSIYNDPLEPSAISQHFNATRATYGV